MTAEQYPAADTPAADAAPESESANIAGGLFMGPAPDGVAPSDEAALPTAPAVPDLGPDAVSVPEGRPPGAVSATEIFGGSRGVVDIPEQTPGPPVVEAAATEVAPAPAAHELIAAEVERRADTPTPPAAPGSESAASAAANTPDPRDAAIADLTRRLADSERDAAAVRAAAADAVARSAAPAPQPAPVATVTVAAAPVLEDEPSPGNGLPPELELRPSGVIRLYLKGVTYTLRRPYVGEVEDFYVAAEEIGQATEALGRELEQWNADEYERAKACQADDRVFVRGTPPVTAIKIRVSAIQANREWMEQVLGALSDKTLPTPADAPRPAWFGNNAVIRDMSEHWMANPLDLGA